MPDGASRRPEPSAKAGLFVDYLSVDEMFSGAFAFRLPWFQRAYAWGEDQAQRFLADICEACEERRPRYFLGGLLLAQDADATRYTIVDGQQRCFTLTIVFALLRHRAPDRDTAARLTRVIALPLGNGDGFGRYRLAPQPAIADFLRDNIQSESAFTRDVDEFAASEVEANIIQNRNRLADVLDQFEARGNDIRALVDFVLTRCLVVMRIVASEDEAWEMLRIEEATGLPFHDAARAKITLIEAMQKEEREPANAIWEQCQATLGDDGMRELIGFIRDLSARQRSSQPVEKDLVTRFRLDRAGLAFMRQVLMPASERLSALHLGRVGQGADRDAIARYIAQMKHAGHHGWCVPALRWLERRGDATPDTAEFFRLLTRKVWMLRICAADIVEHERRFIALANEIADARAIGDMKELAVTSADRRKVQRNLTSRTFYDKRYCRAFLRYLATLLDADPGDIDGYNATIEHVLPRNPAQSSAWLKSFPSPEAVRNNAHRIGNLVFLSQADNQAAGNLDYVRKREALRRSGFRFSIDAAAEDEWTPDVIEARTVRLIRFIFDHWQLPLSPSQR